MKVLIINGSPRSKGNSASIVEQLYKKFSDGGDTVELMNPNQVNFKGCQGCLSCRKNNTLCVVKDELGDMLGRFLDFDFFVIVTPNYYGLITGQLKMFLDRWYCFKDANRKTKFSEGKKIFFIVTQGSPNRDHGKSIIEWGKHFFEGFGLKYYGYILPNCSTENNDMVKVKMPEIMMNINMFV